jgi:hypothetical protein
MRFRQLAIGLSLVLVFEALVVVPDIWTPGRNFMAAILPSLLIDYTNQGRQQNKVSALLENKLLSKAAQLKAEDMVTRGYFAHEGPTGETPWFWLNKVGYSYVYAGENLAVNFFDSNDAYQAWLASPKHRENLLDKKFTEIGLGVAKGQFEGRDSIFIVQFFGSTEESLAKQKISLLSLGSNSRLLSAVGSITNGFLILNRYWAVQFLGYLGYSFGSGRII